MAYNPYTDDVSTHPGFWSWAFNNAVPLESAYYRTGLFHRNITFRALRYKQTCHLAQFNNEGLICVWHIKKIRYLYPEALNSPVGPISIWD